MLILGVLCWLFASKDKIGFAVHLACVYSLKDLNLTICDIAVCSQIWYVYIDFAISRRKVNPILKPEVGELMFIPWVALLAIVIGSKINKMVAVSLVVLVVGYYIQKVDFVSLTLELMAVDSFVFQWMLCCVLIFVPLLWYIKIENKLLLRKLFHLLALVTFMPGLVSNSRQSSRLMIFAFNCVSVVLIIVEAIRQQGNFKLLNNYFNTYCTH